MSTPYVGEIRMFGFDRLPNGWLPCDGSLQPIMDYDLLYQLIGTTYGGDGQQTFAMPDLRGRLPVHQGRGPGLSSYVLGQSAGTETVTLTAQQLPSHNHAFTATSNAASQGSPSPALVHGSVSGETAYASSLDGSGKFTMSPTCVTSAGGNLPHTNLMPTLTVQFCIAAAGIYPPPS